MPKLWSSLFSTFSGAMGAQKLGHPVPELNFVSELNSAVAQHTQRNNPFSSKFQYCPLNANSVSPFLAISYAPRPSCSRHSSSVFTIFKTCMASCRIPASEKLTIVTFVGGTRANARLWFAEAACVRNRQKTAPAATATNVKINTLREPSAGPPGTFIFGLNISSSQHHRLIPARQQPVNRLFRLEHSTPAAPAIKNTENLRRRSWRHSSGSGLRYLREVPGRDPYLEVVCEGPDRGPRPRRSVK